ncbi:MAG: T9SS C-terminal target domain-containing protein [Bacteroidetes bacterium]|nr:MAG: T9SS C-terminal target domain-containing protein [Bacteroidota bacterium]
MTTTNYSLFSVLLLFNFTILLTLFAHQSVLAQGDIIIIEEIGGRMKPANPLTTIENRDLLMYPNPGTDFIRVVPDSDQHAYGVAVFTLAGEKLDERYFSSPPANGFLLDVRRLKADTYLLRIELISQVVIHRFEVAK